jgi:hypothetical protein
VALIEGRVTTHSVAIILVLVSVCCSKITYIGCLQMYNEGVVVIGHRLLSLAQGPALGAIDPTTIGLLCSYLAPFDKQGCKMKKRDKQGCKMKKTHMIRAETTSKTPWAEHLQVKQLF